MRGGLLLVLLIVAAVGCSNTGTPTPTAGGFNDLIAALVLRGVTVTNHVSGDAGCSDLTLYSNAIRLDVTTANSPTVYQLYVFRWRRPADFEAAQQAFQDCVDGFLAINPTAQVEGLEVAPWRAYGPNWPDELSNTITEALRATTSSA